MSHVPAISVVLGAYNAERYLAEAVESILNQTFGDFEFIAVDDGSTDRTLDILRRYAAGDSRLKPVHIAHGGIVDAANAGLREARADLIARFDADDVSLPHRFEKQVQFLAEHPEVVAVGSRMLLMEPYGASLGETAHRLTHAEIEAELFQGSGWSLPQPAAMIRHSAIRRIGGYRNEYLWSEDLDLFLRLAEVGRLANLPEVLVKYRNHPGSTNHKRAHIQDELTRKCVLETYRRRGVPVPAELGLISAVRDGRTMADRYLDWTWAALRARNSRAARRHALRALRLEPFSISAWKATYCALRGH